MGLETTRCRVELAPRAIPSNDPPGRMYASHPSILGSTQFNVLVPRERTRSETMMTTCPLWAPRANKPARKERRH